VIVGYGITFAPLVATEILWAAIAIAAIAAVLLLVIRSRGAWMRVRARLRRAGTGQPFAHPPGP